MALSLADVAAATCLGVFLKVLFDSHDRVLLDKNVLGAGADIPRAVAILHDHHQ
jgi:hypothetical protein